MSNYNWRGVVLAAVAVKSPSVVGSFDLAWNSPVSLLLIQAGD